jgi:hypothetical protein
MRNRTELGMRGAWARGILPGKRGGVKDGARGVAGEVDRVSGSRQLFRQSMTSSVEAGHVAEKMGL